MNFISKISLIALLLAMAILPSCKKIFRSGLHDRVYTNDEDADGDGLPDLYEVQRGLDPFKSDSRDSGTSDGARDDDGDGLSNLYEYKLGFDPMVADSCSTVYPNVTCGAGVKDGDKDLDGDGVPVAWELKYGLDPNDPADANDTVLDADKDGFANAEEYPDYDPTDATKPGTYFTLYDDDNEVASRTNSVNVRATFSFCMGSEYVYLSESSSKPSADSSGFKACSTTKFGFTVTLANTAEGTYTVYAWRKVNGKVLDNPPSAKVVMDTTAPTGSISAPAHSSDATSIPLTITIPTSSDYNYLALYEKAQSCSINKTTGDLTSFTPTGTTTTQTMGGSYVTDSVHCFRVYFTDDVGNESSDSVTANEVESRTKSIPTAASCGASPTSRIWYIGSTASYAFSCDKSVTSVADPNGNWPSYLSTTVDSPSTGQTKVSGTTNAVLALTSYTGKINDDAANTKTFGLGVVAAPTLAVGTSMTVADNDASTSTISMSMTHTATWNGADSSVFIKGLMGDISSPTTTSNGTVASTESNIPLLVYSDVSCSTSVPPTICPGSSTGLSNPMSLLWDYGPFDQGQYFLGVQSLATVEGASFYSGRSTAAVSVSDPGGEPTILTSTGTATSELSTFSWSSYQPALAFADSVSSKSKQVFEIVFPSKVTNYLQFAGIGSIDRTSTASTWTTVSTSLFAETAGSTSEVSDNRNSTDLAIAATASSSGKWLVLSSQTNANSGNDLVLSRFLSSDSSKEINRLNISAFPTGASSINSIAMTKYYSDAGGSGVSAANRHGVAFYAEFSNANRGIYVSKINSDTTSTTESALFDATNWYNTVSNSAKDYVSSVPLFTPDTNVRSLVRMEAASESSVPYFYVGWRNDSAGTVALARVEANTSSPTIWNLQASDITSFDNFGAQGYDGGPDYSLASGLTVNGATTASILGVLSTSDDGSGSASTKCYFTPVTVKSATELQFAAAKTAISSAVDCRFAHLFFNTANKKFMAVYVMGSGGNKNDTFYREFSVSNTYAVTLGTETSVTNRGTTAADTICKFAATYSPTLQRIGMVSVQGNCASTGNHTLKYDMYKTYESPQL